MTKAKVDVEIEDGVHVTVTAEGATKKEALERAYNRSVAILKFVDAISAESEVASFEVEDGLFGSVPVEPDPIAVWEVVKRSE